MKKMEKYGYRAVQQNGKILVLSKTEQPLFAHRVYVTAPLSVNALLTEKLASAYMSMWKDLNVQTIKNSKSLKGNIICRNVFDLSGIPLVSYRCMDRSGNAYAVCGKFEQQCIQIYNKYFELVHSAGITY